MSSGQRGTNISLTKEALALGGMKHVRQIRPLVHWAAERVKEGVVLDVGAHFGTFAIMLLRKRLWLFCHAFEPNPEAAKACQRMGVRNRVTSRLTVHRLALMDTIGQGALRIPKASQFSGLATLGKPMRFKGHTVAQVNMTRLDSWAAEWGIGHVDLIKVDVEGAELFTLKGAEQIINRDHPLLILEHQARNMSQLGTEKGAVEDLLTSWGYRWQRKVRDLLCE